MDLEHGSGALSLSISSELPTVVAIVLEREGGKKEEGNRGFKKTTRERCERGNLAKQGVNLPTALGAQTGLSLDRIMQCGLVRRCTFLSSRDVCGQGADRSIKEPSRSC